MNARIQNNAKISYIYERKINKNQIKNQFLKIFRKTMKNENNTVGAWTPDRCSEPNQKNGEMMIQMKKRNLTIRFACNL